MFVLGFCCRSSNAGDNTLGRRQRQSCCNSMVCQGCSSVARSSLASLFNLELLLMCTLSLRCTTQFPTTMSPAHKVLTVMCSIFRLCSQNLSLSHHFNLYSLLTPFRQGLVIIRKNVCVSLQVQGACMAARLVGVCFSCSLIHPQRPLDFATYTPLELWEGSNLFHDPYR